MTQVRAADTAVTNGSANDGFRFGESWLDFGLHKNVTDHAVFVFDANLRLGCTEVIVFVRRL